MMNTKEIADKQRHADKAHHEKRLKWLSVESPIWSDGVPVRTHEKAEMIVKSNEALALINHGMSTGHCHCEPKCCD